MENITSEMLQTIYDRAKAYSAAKYGSEFDKLFIEDGQLVFEYEEYRCGEYETDHYYVNPEELTSDLDEVAAKRKKEEEERRERERIAEQERKVRYELEQKERRRQEYLKLQKEFGS